jgi:sugar/nucleoside kinase (ribokinase family)
MSLDTGPYDIVFIGHMCFDEVLPYRGAARVAPGSAVLCGALAAARVGGNVAVVTRLAPQDQYILGPLWQNNVAVHAIPSAETTFMRVVHTTPNVDEREIYQLANAGFFSLDDLPPLAARQVHLAGVTDQEFDRELLRGLKEKGYRLSTDMQSFVRQVRADTGCVDLRDVPAKKEIVRWMDRVKLDVVEAKVLTGEDDLERAARMVAGWGCPEVVVTHADGVLAMVEGAKYYEKFTNRSVVGRTGRGDTAFAAYLIRRLDHGPAESLKFAAALVSIKMETPGPFSGTLDEVLARMGERSR